MNNDEILTDSPSTIDGGNGTENFSDFSSTENNVDIYEKLETIIEYQEKQYIMMAQNNINQLFVIGTLSGIIVLVLLYSAIKKFI